MNIRYEATFAKDLKRIRNKQLLRRIQSVIEELKSATDFEQVRNSRKLVGYDSYYRIRIGDYRIGVEVEGEIVYLVRFLHRKDIYSKFP